MQQQQAEKLKKLISTSTMLSEKEKQEWLDLLIVMNDKQISELEAILNPTDSINEPAAQPAQKPVQKVVQPTQPLQPVQSAKPELVSPKTNLENKPLSHISNLPAGITRTDNAVAKPKFPLPRPVPKQSPNSLWQAKFKQIMEEKEIAAPAKQVVATEQPTQRQPALVKKEPIVKLDQPKDVALLNVATMRAMGENIQTELRRMVKMSNYYDVLLSIEKSPLYQAYLLTGKESLNMPAGSFPSSENSNKYLTKEEFEAFSDLLKSIQLG